MSVPKQARLAAVLLVLLIQAAPGHAGIMSGEDLLGICEPQPVDPLYRLKLSQCTGYIIGVADTFDCRNKTLGYTWDSARYASQQKLVDAVVDWFHFHPNVLNYQASGLVASALATAYPCPGSVAAQ